MKSLLVFVALHCLPFAVTAEEVMVVHQSDGQKTQVIAYGQILDGPFTITRSSNAVGKDTILVNGLRLYPRGGRPFDLPEGAEQWQPVEFEEGKHPADISADIRQAMNNDAYTLVEKLDNLEQACLQKMEEGAFTEVQRSRGSVIVRWAYNNRLEHIIPTKKVDMSAKREQAIERIISRFENVIGDGGMVIFGKGYHIEVPPQRMPKMLDFLNELQRGTDPAELNMKGTPFDDELVLQDLLANLGSE